MTASERAALEAVLRHMEPGENANPYCGTGEHHSVHECGTHIRAALRSLLSSPPPAEPPLTCVKCSFFHGRVIGDCRHTPEVRTVQPTTPACPWFIAAAPPASDERGPGLVEQIAAWMEGQDHSGFRGDATCLVRDIAEKLRERFGAGASDERPSEGPQADPLAPIECRDGHDWRPGRLMSSSTETCEDYDEEWCGRCGIRFSEAERYSDEDEPAAAPAPAPDEGRPQEKRLASEASLTVREPPDQGSMPTGCDGEGSRPKDRAEIDLEIERRLEAVLDASYATENADPGEFAAMKRRFHDLRWNFLQFVARTLNDAHVASRTSPASEAGGGETEGTP